MSQRSGKTSKPAKPSGSPNAGRASDAKANAGKARPGASKAGASKSKPSKPSHTKKPSRDAHTEGVSSKPRLGVEIDGRELEEAAAREMWTAFSAYMDAHEGDFAGFARSKGMTEARPEHRAGRAVLVLRR